MIEVLNVSKNYGNHRAVSSLSFTAEKGKIYGFLGPNGAGKSTTMNIITGCLSATDGTVLIDGYDIYKSPSKAKKNIGFLPELPPLYQDMTPYEYLKFVAEAKGLSGVYAENAVNEAIEKTFLSGVRDRLISFLSKGYRQRVGIAQAIIGNPENILLDEPMVGLDPRQVLEIRELIASLKEDHTVIISSHILPEIEEICDELVIIAGGKLIAKGTLNEISEKYIDTKTLSLTVKGNPRKLEMLFEACEDILKYEISNKGIENDIIIECNINSDIREYLFCECAKMSAPILRLEDTTLSLEDVFLKLTEEEDVCEQAEDIRNEEENEDINNAEFEEENENSAEKDIKDNDSDENDDYKPLFGTRED